MAEALFVGGSHDGEWVVVDSRALYALEGRTRYKAKAHINSPEATYSNEVSEIYERSMLVGDVVIYRLQTMTYRDVIERLVRAYVPLVEEGR